MVESESPHANLSKTLERDLYNLLSGITTFRSEKLDRGSRHHKLGLAYHVL